MALRIYKNYVDYVEVIQPLKNGECPLVPKDFITCINTINRKKLDEAIEFCKNNQIFHIKSFVHKNLDYNFYAPNAVSYQLCWGDSDPSIIFVSEAGIIEDREGELSELLEYYFPRKKLKVNKI